MPERQKIFINCTVTAETDEEVMKAVESLARVAAGLAMDGVYINLSMMPDDESVPPYGEDHDG